MAAIHTDARADQVLELVVAGLTRRQIHQWVEEKGKWEIGPRQIDRLIRRAHDALDQAGRPHREHEFAKAVRRLDMLFARSLQINDFKGCLAIERERIALLKLGSLPPRPASIDAAELASAPRPGTRPKCSPRATARPAAEPSR